MAKVWNQIMDKINQKDRPKLDVSGIDKSKFKKVSAKKKSKKSKKGC